MTKTSTDRKTIREISASEMDQVSGGALVRVPGVIKKHVPIRKIVRRIGRLV